MHPLIISLLETGSYWWSVVCSDGCCAETHDFPGRAEAEEFFKFLVNQNPSAVCFVNGQIMDSRPAFGALTPAFETN